MQTTAKLGGEIAVIPYPYEGLYLVPCPLVHQEQIQEWSWVIIGGESTSKRVRGIQRCHFEDSTSKVQFSARSNTPKHHKNEDSYKSQNTLDNNVV